MLLYLVPSPGCLRSPLVMSPRSCETSRESSTSSTTERLNIAPDLHTFLPTEQPGPKSFPRLPDWMIPRSTARATQSIAELVSTSPLSLSGTSWPCPARTPLLVCHPGTTTMVHDPAVSGGSTQLQHRATAPPPVLNPDHRPCTSSLLRVRTVLSCNLSAL